MNKKSLQFFHFILAICKRCREHLQEIVETDPIDPSPEPTEAFSCLQVPSSCETQHDEDNSDNSEKESAKVRNTIHISY